MVGSFFYRIESVYMVAYLEQRCMQKFTVSSLVSSKKTKYYRYIHVQCDTSNFTFQGVAIYEVFYQSAAWSNGSSTTTTTELTLTGLVLGQTYSIFVVAFGSEGAPVLHSDYN